MDKVVWTICIPILRIQSSNAGHLQMEASDAFTFYHYTLVFICHEHSSSLITQIVSDTTFENVDYGYQACLFICDVCATYL